MQIKCKLEHGAKKPIYKTIGASGLDLYVLLKEDRIVYPLETVRFPTGVSLEIPEGYEGQVRGRSGNSMEGILIHFGTVDWDYRGVVGIVITNLSNSLKVITNGFRLAQLVIVPVVKVSLEEVSLLEETDRGDKGYGSTGNL